MARLEFTKHDANSAMNSCMNLYDAIPKYRRSETIPDLSCVLLFLRIAKEKAVELETASQKEREA